jgi:PTH1 family peptidyl-tRNA hydrolase
VLLAKPETFMNRSGQSVRSICDYYKINPSEVLVVCDDCEIPLGEIRIRTAGGPGGHNGLASLVEHLQTEGFPRLRLGIGSPDPGRDLSDFVLSEFRPEERETIENLTNRAVSAMSTSLSFSLEKAMNEFNRKQSNP